MDLGTVRAGELLGGGRVGVVALIWAAPLTSDSSAKVVNGLYGVGADGRLPAA